MGSKKMEGDEDERRRKARDAKRRGHQASEEAATLGASKQDRHLPHSAEHVEKVESIRRGKPPVTSENQPAVRPGHGTGPKGRGG